MVIPWSPLGLYAHSEGPVLSNAQPGDAPVTAHTVGDERKLDFVDNLQCVSFRVVEGVSEVYDMPHGKRSILVDRHNELYLVLAHKITGEVVELQVRIFDDGVAFAYCFPQPVRELMIVEGLRRQHQPNALTSQSGETTAFSMRRADKAWLQEHGTSMAGYDDHSFKEWDIANLKPSHTDPGFNFPALFRIPQSDKHYVYVLLSEAGLTQNYIGTRLDVNGNSLSDMPY